MQISINLIPITSPPAHGLPVVVWDDTGEWSQGWYLPNEQRWNTQSGAVEHLIWWAELPVVEPGGAHHRESEKE